MGSKAQLHRMHRIGNRYFRTSIRSWHKEKRAYLQTGMAAKFQQSLDDADVAFIDGDVQRCLPVRLQYDK